MKKKTKIIWSIIAVIVVVCIIFFKAIVALFMGIMSHVAPYVFKPKDVSKEAAAYTVAADSLYNTFKSDSAVANKKYLGQVVVITGSVTAVDTAAHVVSLNNVACTIDSTALPQINAHKVGDAVKIQGVVGSYNDLMDEVDVSQCSFK